MTSDVPTAWFDPSPTRDRRSRTHAVAGLLTAALFSAACGGPVAPTPPVTPPPPNAAPVIKSVAVSQSVIEVSQSVQITATVEDAETAVDKLQFVWSAPSGSFTGEGASVTWRPSETIATPADPVLTVTVVESYSGLDAQGRIVPLEHRVSGSASVRVHNSEKELGDMGLSFLMKFADSSVSPEACVVDFSDGCSGKADEIRDIQRNREKYFILSHALGTPRFTSVRLYKDADMRIACSFESRVIQCLPSETGCVVGAVERVSGDCRLTGVYEQSRWWLCVSNFFASGAVTPGMRDFFGADVRR